MISIKETIKEIWMKFIERMLNLGDIYIAKQKQQYDLVYQQRLMSHIYTKTVLNNKLIAIEDERVGQAHYDFTVNERKRFLLQPYSLQLTVEDAA
jgi:hypothetical protein